MSTSAFLSDISGACFPTLQLFPGLYGDMTPSWSWRISPPRSPPWRSDTSLVARSSDVAQWLFASDKTRQYHLPFHVVEQIGLRSHRRIIAVSEDMADAVRTRNPMATVTVIPAGLPDEAFEDWTSPRRDILYLGRLEKYGKGLDLLLYAFAKIADHVSQRLVIAGDGTDRHALEALAAALGLRDRVRFVGWIPRDGRDSSGCPAPISSLCRVSMSPSAWSQRRLWP